MGRFFQTFRNGDNMKIFNGSFLLIGACYLCGSAFAVEGKCLTEYGKKKKEEVLLNKKKSSI